MPDQSPQPGRRWFQFRLRTLLIVVAVLAVPCAWVAYSLRWIEQRRAMRDKRTAFGSIIHREDPAAPGLLWLFGEEGELMVLVGPQDQMEAARLFPEASIVEGR